MFYSSIQINYVITFVLRTDLIIDSHGTPSIMFKMVRGNITFMFSNMNTLAYQFHRTNFNKKIKLRD